MPSNVCVVILCIVHLIGYAYSLSTFGCNARVLANGDDSVWLDISRDKRLIYENLAPATNGWNDKLNVTIHNITQYTKLRFYVKNNGIWGGFLATITLNGSNGQSIQLYTDAEMTNFTSQQHRLECLMIQCRLVANK